MSTFAGTWGNSYGSKLVLVSQGELLLGTYRSTTGSTGQYHVIGYGGTLAASANQGVGLALCILWRSFTGDPPDPGWHWVSGFGGQVMLQSDGTPNIILNHDLVATVPFPGVAEAGSYLDKLVYSPAALQGVLSPHPFNLPRTKGLPDPIDGAWQCQSAAMVLSLMVVDDGSGWVEGVLTMDGRDHPVQGFAANDVLADPAPREGLTLAASVGNGQFMAFSGWLDRDTQTLYLLQQTSHGTAANVQYTQTSAQGLYFIKRAGD